MTACTHIDPPIGSCVVVHVVGLPSLRVNHYLILDGVSLWLLSHSWLCTHCMLLVHFWWSHSTGFLDIVTPCLGIVSALQSVWLQQQVVCIADCAVWSGPSCPKDCSQTSALTAGPGPSVSAEERCVCMCVNAGRHVCMHKCMHVCVPVNCIQSVTLSIPFTDCITSDFAIDG